MTLIDLTSISALWCHGWQRASLKRVVGDPAANTDELVKRNLCNRCSPSDQVLHHPSLLTSHVSAALSRRHVLENVGFLSARVTTHVGLLVDKYGAQERSNINNSLFMILCLHTADTLTAGVPLILHTQPPPRSALCTH